MPCGKHVSQSLVKSWREVAAPWVLHWPQEFTNAVSLGLASQDVRTVTFQYFAVFFVTEMGFTSLLIAPVCVEDLFPLNFSIYTLCVSTSFKLDSVMEANDCQSRFRERRAEDNSRAQSCHLFKFHFVVLGDHQRLFCPRTAFQFRITAFLNSIFSTPPYHLSNTCAQLVLSQHGVKSKMRAHYWYRLALQIQHAQYLFL